jgi:hypothetical protein
VERGGKDLGFVGQDHEEVGKVRVVGCAWSGRTMVASMTRARRR